MRRQETTQAPTGHLDAQLAELIEQVWASEAQWRVDDHIDAVIKYGLGIHLAPSAGGSGREVPQA
ncbi:MAG TPA: hypothetical protein VHK65_14940 [Candidatus Dormibacteraeota bacterium]|nr:hypothetical protein [Candidatus Dormibacteraeota bacterium]